MKIKAKVKPKIGNTQRTALLLNEFEPPSDRPARTFRFDATVINPNEIEVPIDNIEVPPGKYLVRVQIDTIESPLKVINGKYAWPIVEIKAGTKPVILHSDKITLAVKSREDDNVTVEGQVKVKNDKNQLVPNAEVSIKWTPPAGSSKNQKAISNSNGIATFTISGENGIYKLQVKDISVSDEHKFDPDTGETEKTIDTSTSQKLLRAYDLTLEVLSEDNNNVSIRCTIIVVDENESPVKDADVTIWWRKIPDRDPERKTDNTNFTGHVFFDIDNGRGVYELEITDISKSGYTFDPQNSKLTESIDTTEKQLRSTDIELSADEVGSLVTVTGRVTVEDESGVPVKDATVSIRWDLNSGSTQNQSADTDSKGVAHFNITGGKDTYWLNVINIVKSNHYFDKLHSKLNNSITVSP